MFKYFFLFIGVLIVAIVVIIRYFPNLVLKIIRKLFNKMYGVEPNEKQKKQQKITIEKKKNNDTVYSDYEIIDEKNQKKSNSN